jgi:hypothetical protein
MSTANEINVIANDVDSDAENIQSTLIDVIAAVVAFFLTLNRFRALVQSIRGELKAAADNPGMTIIESTGKRIAE